MPGRRLYSGTPLLTLAVCGALLTSTCGGTAEYRASRHLDAGDRYRSAGRFPAAAIEYRNAVKVRPADIDSYLRLGDAQQASERPAEAYRTFVKAITIAPQDARPRVAAGRLLLAANRIAEAQAQAEAALGRNPASGEARVLLGTTLTRTGDWERAEDVLRAAVAIGAGPEPGAVPARVALADLLIVQARVTEAEVQLEAAIQAHPDDELVNRAMAALLVMDGRSGAAERFLRIAADVTAQRYRSSLALADFYIADGRLADARAVLSSMPAGVARLPPLTRAVQARLEALSVY